MQHYGWLVSLAMGRSVIRRLSSFRPFFPLRRAIRLRRNNREWQSWRRPGKQPLCASSVRLRLRSETSLRKFGHGWSTNAYSRTSKASRCRVRAAYLVSCSTIHAMPPFLNAGSRRNRLEMLACAQPLGGRQMPLHLLPAKGGPPCSPTSQETCEGSCRRGRSFTRAPNRAPVISAPCRKSILPPRS